MIFIINCIVVAVVVFIHYEFLFRLTNIIPKMKIKHRFRIIVGVLVSLVAHTIEICVFATVYYFLPYFEELGSLSGAYYGYFTDSVYFSFTTYTTLGFGDIQPHGHIRHLVGIESLTGLLLITWTASFLYYEMQRYWDKR